MMRIAILGATSELARDLVRIWTSATADVFALYSRRPEDVERWIRTIGLEERARAFSYDCLDGERGIDVLINFVGVGNPAKAKAMGTSILDVTQTYDSIALSYLERNAECRYIFLSSGAVFGSKFDQPVDSNTLAMLPINSLRTQDWYSIAKLNAECRHRSRADLPIIDVRVFSYFSHTQDMSSTYFMADLVNAYRRDEELVTSSLNIVRDYVAPTDFFNLIWTMATAPRVNTAVDCYSRAPIDKFSILEWMRTSYGLFYVVASHDSGSNVAAKENYYSVNKKAQEFGYEPECSSLESIAREMFLLSKERLT
jgi:nucleoside-diphosphate-sugar epimerase